jgi:hypothetical protein
MLCFRCKLMFENKNNKKKYKAHKLTLSIVLASHRIKALKSLNEFRRGSLLTFDCGLHASLCCCKAPDYYPLMSLKESHGM